MKSIKLSDYFKVVNPVYTFLKLKPNNSIRNNGTYKLARTISSLYKSVLENIKKEEGKLIRVLGKEFLFGTKFSYQMPSKVSYYIYIEQKTINFYFIIPSHHLSILKEKMSDVWSGITVEEVKELPTFADSCTKYELVLEKEDGLSLGVDRRNNELLESNMNIVEVLQEKDRAGIFYNFIPASPVTWKHQYRHTIDKVKKGIPVDRNKMGFNYFFKFSLAMIDGLVNSISETLVGKKKVEEENILEKLLDKLNGGRKVSEATSSKANAHILGTQIVVFSESKDKLRERNNGRSLAQSFDVISQDNRLTFKPFNKSFQFTDYTTKSEINKVGDPEVQNFISLPGRDLLEYHDFIEKVETSETKVPEDLRKGTMCIGISTYRGFKQKAYLTTHYEYKNLTLVLIGPTRAGKSTLIGNLARDAIRHKECTILFDFIEKCELSTEVSALFPSDKVLTLDCSDFDKLEGLGYNEIGFSEDPFIQYKNAKQKTEQLETLVNSINTDESRLSAKMGRFLAAASMTVFLTGGSIKNVFDVLQNHKVRMDFLKKIPEDQKQRMEEYIFTLEELNEFSEKTIENKTKDGKTKTKITELSGTRDHLITGILDRLYRLKANAFMEEMLKRSTANNVDLSVEIQKPQLICIKMPETEFKTKAEKDICCTYWITKLWGALQVRSGRLPRSERLKVNMIIDEIYQVETTEKFLTDKLSQMAKFGVKPIISCHYINQMKHIRQELRSANASYMMIAGCDKKNFDELKEELYHFTDEDLLRLKPYHSLNLVKNKDGYGQFITKLPPPVKRIKRKMKGPFSKIRTIKFKR